MNEEEKALAGLQKQSDRINAELQAVKNKMESLHRDQSATESELSRALTKKRLNETPHGDISALKKKEKKIQEEIRDQELTTIGLKKRLAANAPEIQRLNTEIGRIKAEKEYQDLRKRIECFEDPGQLDPLMKQKLIVTGELAGRLDAAKRFVRKQENRLEELRKTRVFGSTAA